MDPFYGADKAPVKRGRGRGTLPAIGFSREIRALGRILNRVADLARAQLAALEALACGDPGCIEIAEQRVSRCQERLRQVARSLDRVLAQRGDDDGRRRLVEGALRLAAGSERNGARLPARLSREQCKADFPARRSRLCIS